MEQKWDYFARNSGKTIPDAREVHNRLREARAAAKAGRYEEALDGYIWFHENSVNIPGLGGVRLSFALVSWIDLGRVALRCNAVLADPGVMGDFPGIWSW